VGFRFKVLAGVEASTRWVDPNLWIFVNGWLQRLRGGVSRRQAAAQFGGGISTVVNWVRRFRETGSELTPVIRKALRVIFFNLLSRSFLCLKELPRDLARRHGTPGRR
jgi:Helix-turn-helix domain